MRFAVFVRDGSLAGGYDLLSEAEESCETLNRHGYGAVIVDITPKEPEPEFDYVDDRAEWRAERGE